MNNREAERRGTIVRILTLGVVIAAALLAGRGAEGAVQQAFTDGHANWAGWNVYSGDTIGTPQITGGIATANEGGGFSLSALKINYNSNVLASSINTNLRFGDLFLDTNNDQQWDYVIKGDTYGGNIVLPAYNLAAGATYDLQMKQFTGGIAIGSKDLANTNYQLSDSSTERSGASWSGMTIRNGHPWALNDSTWNSGTSVGTVDFTGWQDNKTAGASSWLFGGDGLALTAGADGHYRLGIGFTMNCANDVLFETVDFGCDKNPPVPEPATMVIWSLLGVSGFGLAWLRGRKAAGR